MNRRKRQPAREFDTNAFRRALGCFPTGVAVVITQLSDRKPIGITVNSFGSVSLDPPLILWCLDRRSERFRIFTSTQAFTISVLGTSYQDVSSRLARQGEHSLEGIPLLETPVGPPALADALAIFECAREAVHNGGDHAILVGRVLRFARRNAGAPLIFFRGRYGALAKAEED